MSEPCRKEEFSIWKWETIRDFGAYFYDLHDRFPTEKECKAFWEEYLDGDIRVGEE